MKNNPDVKINRILSVLVRTVFCIPIYVSFFAFDQNPLVIISLFYLIAFSIGDFVRSKKSSILILIGLVLILLVFIEIGRKKLFQADDPDQLNIGKTIPESGVDVFCNDVFLGKTPFKLYKKDFKKKVHEWSNPPRQKILKSLFDKYRNYDNNYDYPYAQYYLTPENPFKKHSGFGSDNNSKRKLIINSKYWWRFDLNGCMGLNFKLTPMRGNSFEWERNSEMIPRLIFPSRKKHVDYLVEDLHDSNFNPSDIWLEHFKKYFNLIFGEFYKRVKRDKRLTFALESVVRSEFCIPDIISQNESDRIVKEILERVEKKGCFVIPSPESVCLDLFGKELMPSIEKSFLKELTETFTKRDCSSSENSFIFPNPEKGINIAPIEYAIANLCPPNLLNKLVYESRINNRYFDIVANYGVDRLEKLAKNYYDNTKYKYSYNAIKFVKYSKICINSPGINPEYIIKRIESVPYLRKNEKTKLIMRINSRESIEYLNKQKDILNSRYRSKLFISQISETPNSSFDSLIIEIHKKYGHSLFFSRVTFNLCFLRNDTEKIREYIREIWSKGLEEQKRLINDFLSVIWCNRISKYDHDEFKYNSYKGALGWFVQDFYGIQDMELKDLTVKLLEEIDTPEARDLIQFWRETSEPGISAGNAISMIEIKLNRDRQRKKEIADLLSGKIKPDDLILKCAYIWNGNDYVPENDMDKKIEKMENQ
jgi:hypothetical protein